MNVTEGERSDEAPTSKPALGGSVLGDILRDLFKNALDLVQSEVKLAATEMSWKLSKQVKRSQLMRIGASVAYAGFLLILVAAVIELSVLIPAGLAALVVGVAVLLAGIITMRIGQKRRSEEDFIPRQTINTLREEAKWMRDQLM